MSSNGSWVDRLSFVESPGITARRKRREETAGLPFDPIVYAKADGVHVTDTEGNNYLDLCCGFGSLLWGHRHPSIVDAINTAQLHHALGDLYPSIDKIVLLEKLSEISPWGKQSTRIILTVTGNDAVEAALKTAMLNRPNKPGVIACESSYHGLGYGGTSVTGLHPKFREPFAQQLNPHVHFVPYPGGNMNSFAKAFESVLGAHPNIGTLLVEPALGRGGTVFMNADEWASVHAIAAQHRLILVSDEVMTGMGRLGSFFQDDLYADHLPDLICVGKSLGGGLPLSAVLGTLNVMQAWGNPDQEAIHTSTFAGHALACRTALTFLNMLDATSSEEIQDKGRSFMTLLKPLERYPEIKNVRGKGLLLGIEFHEALHSMKAFRKLLELGFIVSLSEKSGRTLQLTPSVLTEESHMQSFVDGLKRMLDSGTLNASDLES